LTQEEEPKKGLVFMTTATVRKWGNSLAIRIPHEVTERVKFDDGVQVEMLVTENKEILLRPAFPAADDQDALRKHFLALRAQCKPGMAAAHEEAFAEPMGDEIF
jgi:antitoxin component of MazEF toxin-antitoxin module